MTLTELKTIYNKANNINFINIINKIEEINFRTHLSISKIIEYLQSNCTSKIDKKNLNILANHFPTIEHITEYEINLILNKNIQKEQLIENIKIEEKNIEIKKIKKSKAKKLVNNDIDSKQEQ